MIEVAKIVKKKRRLRVERLVSMFFALSVFLYLGSSLFLQSYNMSLSKLDTQRENEIIAAKKDKESMRVAVEQLQNRDRILAVAKDAGIDVNQDSVVILDGNN